MNLSITQTSIPDVLLLKTPVFGDSRGFFSELFKASVFTANGIQSEFTQDNYSYSTRNVVRGLHFQRDPHAQGKLIRCLKGGIFDVAVDIRPGSPTRGKWVGWKLSETSGEMLYLPPGFAHGFQVLTDDAYVLYKCTQDYAPGSEGGVLWNDPELGIKWPLSDAIVSEKDSRLPVFSRLP